MKKCLCTLPKERDIQWVNPGCPFHGENGTFSLKNVEELKRKLDYTVGALDKADQKIMELKPAWTGKKTEHSFEVLLFTSIKKVRIELLGKDRKHLDYMYMTFKEYLHVCGFKDMVEKLLNE